jgi:hypothetical protein
VAIDPLTPPPPRGVEIAQGEGKPTNIQWYGWFGRLQKRINELVAGSVTQLVAGTNITLSPLGGTGVVTVSASGIGGTGTVTSVSAGSSDIVIGGTPTVAPTVDLAAAVKADLALAATALQSVPLTVDHTLLADFYGAPDDVWPVMAVPGTPGINGTNGVNGINSQALSELLWLESTSEDAWPVMAAPGLNGTNGINGTNATALSQLLWLEIVPEDQWPAITQTPLPAPLISTGLQSALALANFKSALSTSIVATLATDASLTVTCPVGWYDVEAFLVFFEATLGTGGFQFDFNGGTAVIANPAFAVNGFSTAAFSNAATTSISTATSIATVGTSSTAPSWVRVKGTIHVTTAGTFAVRWAQASLLAADPTTLAAGSHIILTNIG